MSKKRSKRNRIPRNKHVDNPCARTTQKYIGQCSVWYAGIPEFTEDLYSKARSQMMEAESRLFPQRQVVEITTTVLNRTSGISLEMKVADYLDFSIEDLDGNRFCRRELQNYAKKHKIRANLKSTVLLASLKNIFQDTLANWQDNGLPADLIEEDSAEMLVQTQPSAKKVKTKNTPASPDQMSQHPPLPPPAKKQKKPLSPPAKQQKTPLSPPAKKQKIPSPPPAKQQKQQVEDLVKKLQNPTTIAKATNPPVATAAPTNLRVAPSNLRTGPFRQKSKKKKRARAKNVRSEEDIIAEKEKVRIKRAKRQEEEKGRKRILNEAKRRRVQARKEQLQLEQQKKQKDKEARERKKIEAKRLREVKKAQALAKSTAEARAKKQEQAAAKRRKEEKRQRIIEKKLAAKEATRALARQKKLEEQQLAEEQRLTEEKRVAEIKRVKAMSENSANTHNKKELKPQDVASCNKKPPASSHKQKRKSEFVNYAMSESGSESEESSDDDSQPKKKVPGWASKSYLKQSLRKQASQRGADPDTIFPSIPDTCDLEAIFPNSRTVKAKAKLGRKSSGVWGPEDQATISEIREWRAHHNLPVDLSRP